MHTLKVGANFTCNSANWLDPPSEALPYLSPFARDLFSHTPHINLLLSNSSKQCHSCQ